MKTLIIEFFATGHYPEYLNHVLKRLNYTGKHFQYIIYLSTRLKEKVIDFIDTPIYNSIYFFSEEVSLDYSKLESTKDMSDFMFDQILEIKKRHDFDHILFLNLNFILLQFSVINPFNSLPFTFSGIFFNSPYRLRKTRKKKIKVWKKELVIRLLTINKKCKKIFLLNDKKGAEYYGKWSSKIKYIVDPVLKTKASDLDIYKHHCIENSSITFTHIGYLGNYKGTFEVIESIHKIQSINHLNCVFLFVGKMLKELKDNFKELTQGLDEAIIKTNEGFISDQDFMAYIKQTDVVLIANKNVFSTSGIVNHCLSNNKVVIAPNKGYFKEKFSDYKGAILYDENLKLDKAIIYSTENILNLKHEAASFNSFIYKKENSASKFSEMLLENT